MFEPSYLPAPEKAKISDPAGTARAVGAGVGVGVGVGVWPEAGRADRAKEVIA
jgi:hypothetical protein